MKKKGFVSITEFAKLRGVTTETLRHYDRIDLLKPAYIDPATRIRYYSLSFESEKLGTILELKQMNMSLPEIKDFLDNRNFDKSLNTLKKKTFELDLEIQRLQNLSSSIKNRIESMEKNSFHHAHLNEISTKVIKKREMVLSGSINCDEYDVSLSSVILESKLKKTTPIIGYSRFALIFPREFLFKQGVDAKCKVGIIVERGEVDEKEISVIPGSLYACMYVYGSPLNLSDALIYLKHFCSNNGYEIIGDMILNLIIDMNLTDIPEENICELQIPVKKNKYSK